jgi:opacity protein-like surface antigen
MVSKGKTVDVYSHEGLNYSFGTNLERSFLNDKLTVSLAYEYKKLPVIELTQGAYTGSIYRRHHNPNTVRVALNYKF